MNWNYVWTFLAGYFAGVAIARLYWSKAITVGTELLKRAQGSVEAALKHVAEFPAKFLAEIKQAVR